MCGVCFRVCLWVCMASAFWIWNNLKLSCNQDWSAKFWFGLGREYDGYKIQQLLWLSHDPFWAYLPRRWLCDGISYLWKLDTTECSFSLNDFSEARETIQTWEQMVWRKYTSSCPGRRYWKISLEIYPLKDFKRRGHLPWPQRRKQPCSLRQTRVARGSPSTRTRSQSQEAPLNLIIKLSPDRGARTRKTTFRVVRRRRRRMISH